MKRGATEHQLRLLKLCLCVVTLFYWVTSFVLMWMGASVQIKLHAISAVLSEASSGTTKFLTAVGFLIFILSTFGVLAVLKENPSVLKVFAALMLMLFVAEIIVGISAYEYRDKLQHGVLKSFRNVLMKYGADHQLSKGVDVLQQKFQCCGAQNYTDWLNSTYGFSIPPSCCKTMQESCGTQDTGDIYPQVFGIIISYRIVKLLQGNYDVV
ncbi:tetraspanin-7-like isoform X2 [Rhinatrema bivittatum]|uniref:tetraspanin-7-like isoform X2 n=1 Tax=Rhinatrema bivittatum TaxID=194408 RepID=UPI00112933B5|nr:tetraspanin-7-like isoform X2 [Rhinatrema bivittatum]